MHSTLTFLRSKGNPFRAMLAKVTRLFSQVSWNERTISIDHERSSRGWFIVPSWTAWTLPYSIFHASRSRTNPLHRAKKGWIRVYTYPPRAWITRYPRWYRENYPSYLGVTNAVLQVLPVIISSFILFCPCDLVHAHYRGMAFAFRLLELRSGREEKNKLACSFYSIVY